MKLLDSILLTLLLWGAYKGFKRGLVLEIFSLASFGIAMTASVALKNQLTNLYVRWYGSLGSIAHYAISTLLAIIVVILVALVGRILRYFINLALLGDIDKALGVVLGVFKWAFLSSIFLWVGRVFNLEIPDIYTTDTILFPLIEPLAPQLVAWLTPQIAVMKAWRDSMYPAGMD